jgi:hypothetical protein
MKRNLIQGLLITKDKYTGGPKIIASFCVRYLKTMMEDVRVKLNLGLPWQKLHSTIRRLSLPANCT